MPFNYIVQASIKWSTFLKGPACNCKVLPLRAAVRHQVDASRSSWRNANGKHTDNKSLIVFAVAGSRASFQSKHISLKRSPLTILEGLLVADQQQDSSAAAVTGMYLLPDIYLLFPASREPIFPD